MGLILSSAARNAAADAIGNLLDAGSGAAKIRVYTASRPAGPDTAITSQTLLAEFTLNDPAFVAASGGVKALDNTPVPAATGLAAGTAAWFRMLDSNSAAVVDGLVSGTGGAGDLQLTTTAVTVGQSLEVTSGTLTMPAGVP